MRNCKVLYEQIVRSFQTKLPLNELKKMPGVTSRYEFPNKFSNICFISKNEIGSYMACRIKQNVESLPQASFSPILTLSSYVLFHHNSVQPPRFQCNQKTNGKVDKQYPSEQLTVNNLHEPWCDYISNLVVEGKVYQEADRIYFMDFVSNQYIQIFIQSDIFEFKQLSEENVQNYQQKKDFASIIQQVNCLQKKKVKKTKQMAAVCFSATSAMADRYMPKVHIAGLFFGLFYRQTDEWKIYTPLKGALPTKQQLQELDGIVLSGSAYSVYEDVPEINKLMSMLTAAYKNNQKLQILGFCFGHQSIAYAFGGKVQKMKNLYANLQNIKFDNKKVKEMKLEWFNEQSPFQSQKQNYLVSEFHGDAVVQIPDGFDVIASSQSCPVEAMTSQNRRIMSFQFHMQYTPEFAAAYELRLRSYDSDCKYGRIYDGSTKIKSNDRNMRSIFELRQASRKFLDFDRTKVQSI